MNKHEAVSKWFGEWWWSVEGEAGEELMRLESQVCRYGESDEPDEDARMLDAMWASVKAASDANDLAYGPAW